MSALRATPAAELDAARAEVHTAIAGGRRSGFFESLGVDTSGSLPGPFNAMVRAPAVGMPLHRLGEALRYDGKLPALVREAVILRVAVVRRSAFEWRSHVDAARRAGAGDTLLNALREHAPEGPAGVALAVRMADDLLAGRPVSPALVDESIAVLGEEGAVELVVLVGYYDMLAALMRTFAVE